MAPGTTGTRAPAPTTATTAAGPQPPIPRLIDRAPQNRLARISPARPPPIRNHGRRSPKSGPSPVPPGPETGRVVTGDTGVGLALGAGVGVAVGLGEGEGLAVGGGDAASGEGEGVRVGGGWGGGGGG